MPNFSDKNFLFNVMAIKFNNNITIFFLTDSWGFNTRQTNENAQGILATRNKTEKFGG